MTAPISLGGFYLTQYLIPLTPTAERFHILSLGWYARRIAGRTTGIPALVG